MTLSTLDWALAYQQHGFAVYPMVPGSDGSPKGTSTFNSASTDPKQAKAWWGQHPAWGVGLCLMDTGIMVLDIDRNHESGSDGIETINKLYKQGAERLPVDTYTEQTPRGGLHIFLTYPVHLHLTRGTNRFSDHGELTGIDYEAMGIPVAPTRRFGKCYTPAPGHKLTTIRPAPQWVLDGVTAKKTAVGFTGKVNYSRRKTYAGKLIDDLAQDINQGTRNDRLTQLAGKLLASTAEPESVWTVMRDLNALHVDPPLPDKELAGIFASIAEREARKGQLNGRN